VRGTYPDTSSENHTKPFIYRKPPARSRVPVRRHDPSANDPDPVSIYKDTPPEHEPGTLMRTSIEGPWRVALAAALAVIAAGCAPSTSITRDEAEELIDEHTTAAADALPDELELDTTRRVSAPPCDSSENRIWVSQSFWLDGLPKEDNDTNVDALVQHWQDNGYEITTDERPQKLRVGASHSEDGFTLRVRTSVEGYLSMTVSSPCFWPEGSRWTWGG
jgi:hypothetical protein